MNKKFLSAILFGALMVTSTGTFVSCKDYDDDIENLQSQINNLATKSDVEAKLAQLQSALNAAQAESSANAADIAALEKEVASMQAKIQAAVEADMAKYKADIEALIKKVEGVVGEIADYVTSVELVSSYTHEAEWPLALDFFTVTEKANVFEENIAGAIEFVKGKQTQVAKTPILVRVSPTNAVLTKDMISLVNSKGENLDAYVDVEVAPYKKLMSVAAPETDAEVSMTRAAENNGLWEVTVTLKEYNQEQFESLQFVDPTKDEKMMVLYAVQVNNALASEETASRYVTSSYDVTLGGHSHFAPAGNLLFTVDGISVEKLNNRFAVAENKSLKQTENLGTLATEYTWNTAEDNQKDYPTPAVAIDKDKKNVVKDVDDNRSTMDVALAVQGKALTIAIDNGVKNDDYEGKIAAMYVTLDKANAVESAPSELNAWNSYEYTGLNKVVEGTSTTITINSKETINDYIGFRVYAVNQDGTLVDPDGKAFYVLVGDQAQEINAIATSITPVSEELVATEAVEVKALADLGKYYFSWEMDDTKAPKFNLNFVVDDKANNVYIEPGTKSSVYTINRVLKIAAKPTEDWYKYEDGKAYTGTLKAYKVVDGYEFVAATMKVSFTKNIPTTAPEGFSVKTNQVVNGIYNCYLIPMKDGVITWTAEGANQGSMAMDQIFNFPTAEGVNVDKYTFFFATSQDKEGKETYTETAKVVGKTGNIVVAKKLIDNATKHATTATYDYGYISSVNHAAAKKAGKEKDAAYNVIVEVPEVNFETVYNCIYNDTYTWAWATREQLHAAFPGYGWMNKTDGKYDNELPELTLTYGEEFSLTGIDDYIFGQSAWDAEYNSMLNPSYKKSLKIVSATFTSDANGAEEYFKPVVSTEGRITKLEVVPNKSNPTADVASTLTIKVKDMYGHDRVITIPGVVKQRSNATTEE